MTPRATPIRFKARLHRPAEPKGATWAFLLLPASASAKLPARGMVGVAGTLAGQPFKATLEPDGQRSHWLKVPRALRDKAGVAVGDTVSLEVLPSDQVPAPRVPADLREALAAHPEARAQWASLAPVARRDWIQWLDAAKQAETRARRVRNSCGMLVSGKRRVCCFDRSGVYSGAITVPTAAE